MHNKMRKPASDYHGDYLFFFHGSVIVVGLFGILGTLCRYCLGVLLQQVPTHYPLNTVIVNALGCFMAGIFMRYVYPRLRGIYLKNALIYGFLPGLTVFGTVSLDAIHLLHQKTFLWSILSVIFNMVASMLFICIGYFGWDIFFSRKK